MDNETLHVIEKPESTGPFKRDQQNHAYSLLERRLVGKPERMGD